MSIVAIIPARGGSSSILRKNLVDLGGKPLVAWPIETALGVSEIDRVVVSSEDREILKVAKRFGAIGLKRPVELAQDATPTLPVLQHAVAKLEEDGDRVDVVLLLYPTTPFLRASRIHQGLALFQETGCNSVLGVVAEWKTHWVDDGGGLRRLYPLTRVNRQYLKPIYKEMGEIFWSRRQVVMEKNKIVDETSVQLLHVSGEEELIEIDEPADLERAAEWLRLHKGAQ